MGIQHESAGLIFAGDLRERCGCGHPVRNYNESARLTITSSDQRTKAKRKEHLPCNTALANRMGIRVQQWSNHETKEVEVRGAEGAKCKRNRRRKLLGMRRASRTSVDTISSRLLHAREDK